MALYLGNNEKLKVILGNVSYSLNFFSKMPITNGIRLLSAENFILQDSNRLYLTVEKESE